MALYPTGDAAEHKKLTSFLAFVKSNDLELDALSIHAYGAANWRTHLQVARDALAAANLTAIPIQFTEINAVDTSSSHAQQKLELANYTVAAGAFGMIAELIQARDVEQVYWAQFLEPGASVPKWGGPWGSVDIDGNVLASYNAFAVYARMPTAAVRVDIGSGVGALASANESRAALVVWSISDAVVSLTACLTGLPFARGRLSVYRIDETHCSFSNTRDPAAAALRPVSHLQFDDVQMQNASWSGELPARAVVYLEMDRVAP
jgi:hypothetical protein